MGALKIVLIPVMIVTIIAGSYFAIVDGIKDAITMKLGEIQAILADLAGTIKEEFRYASNWIKDKTNIGDYTLPDKPQTLFFEISKDKFEKVKVAIDDIINVEEGGYDDILIKKMLLTYYSSICTRDTEILIYITQDEYDNFVDSTGGSFKKVKGDEIGGKAEDLYLATYGITELYKEGDISEDNKMIYYPMEDLDKIKKDATENNLDNAIEALSKCYTIKDIGKIQMYKINTTSGSTKTDYANGKEKEDIEAEKTNVAELVELDYGQYSSPYVIPVEFLADFLNITGSPDFIDKFSALQYDSYVRLGVYETSLTKTTTTTREYNLNTTITGTKSDAEIESNVNHEALSSLFAKYPHNTKWRGGECFGFVNELTSEYYGQPCDSWYQPEGKGHPNNTYMTGGDKWKKSTSEEDLRKVKPGDSIRYHRSENNTVGHSAWVIGRNGNVLTLAEANWAGVGLITWDRKITIEEILADNFDYICIAPYEIGKSSEDAAGDNTETTTDTSAEPTKEKVEYNEIQPTVVTKVEDETNRNYQMEIVELDTWYVNIKQTNTLESNTIYQTWNETGELVDVEKSEEAVKISKPNIGPSTYAISTLKGINKDIINRLIKNSKETDVTWETQTSTLQDITESKLATTVASTLNKSTPVVVDNTDKFLALLKNTDGKYSRDAAKNGSYDPNGKVVPYDDIYKGTAYVGDLLKNGDKVLFELLEDNLIGDEPGTSNTQGLVDVMKYIMWRYTGVNYGITNFSLIDVMHSGLNMVGADISVKAEGESDLILTKEKILETIDAMSNYPTQAKTNMKGAINGLMKIQNEYKVNAVFALAVTMTESTGGTNWDAIESSTYNWCSVKNGSNGWCKYSSFNDAIEKFGNLIANGNYYFKTGKTSVRQIAPTYCNEKWGNTVIGFMTEFYQTAGVSVQMFSGGDFLNTAKKCHDYLRQNEYFYSYGDNKNAKAYVTDGPADKHGGIVADYVPKPNETDGCNIVDCSSYVSWVLYEYGYTEFAGAQKSSTYFYNQQYPSSYGWQKIESKDAQPGDILVNSGHVEIYAGDNKSYSCGSTKAIRATISDCNPSSFSFAIRVSSK